MALPDPMAALRERMVRTQLERRDIHDARVLAVMRTVPRHRFMPEHRWLSAYADGPVDIGHGQTISQPYIVAFMTQALGVGPGDRVLDVGTGSGYQAAVLAELGCEVYSVEIIDALAERAAVALEPWDDVHLRRGDGSLGWPERAPFDAILAGAAPREVPEALQEQLDLGGRLLLPVGDGWHQDLVLIERTGERSWTRRTILPVLFVPMTGGAQTR